MLYKNAVDEKTYFLLKKLMKDDELKNFNLVGGTALSLQLGHRKSIDLDLFSKKDFDSEKLKHYLIKEYKFEQSFQEKNTLKGFIDNVLIDCIKYDYEYINKVKIIDEIRLLSMEDIVAMKFVAIYQDGTRMKDFIDIAYLSNYFSLNQMIEFCNKKYNTDNTFSILKSITYFDNIDYTENIIFLDENYSFEKVKKHLIEMTNNPDKVLKFS